jgi:hypothetical protein
MLSTGAVVVATGVSMNGDREVLGCRDGGVPGPAIGAWPECA